MLSGRRNPLRLSALLISMIGIFFVSANPVFAVETTAQQRRQARLEKRTESSLQQRALLRARSRREEAEVTRKPVVRRTSPASLRATARMNARLSRRSLRQRATRQTALPETKTENSLFGLLNEKRIRLSIDSLRENALLNRAADQHLRQMIRNGDFSSAAFTDDALEERLKDIGYINVDEKTCDCASWSYGVWEVFARGSQDPAKILTYWLENASAKDQLLSDGFSEVGIAHRNGVWVLILGHIEVEKRTLFTSSQRSRFADEVFRLTNEERAKEGLDPYVRNELLDHSAFLHAKDMYDRDYFAHETPEGKEPRDRIEATGYLDDLRGYGVGENIARGQGSPEAVMEAWMNSPGHRANILHDSFEEIGIGLFGDVWGQNFGKRIK